MAGMWSQSTVSSSYTSCPLCPCAFSMDLRNGSRHAQTPVPVSWHFLPLPSEATGRLSSFLGWGLAPGFHSFILLIYSVCVRTCVSVWANTTRATSANPSSCCGHPGELISQVLGTFLSNLPSRTHTPAARLICAQEDLGCSPDNCRSGTHTCTNTCWMWSMAKFWREVCISDMNTNLSFPTWEEAWKVWATHMYLNCQNVQSATLE